MDLDFNLGYCLGEVSAKTALAVYPWWGAGKKVEADQAAVTMVQQELAKLPYLFKVVVGEGEDDLAPFVETGQLLGQGNGTDKHFDLGLDPLEGTTNFAGGREDSLVVLVVADSGSLLPVPDTYMDQIAVGPLVGGGVVSLEKTTDENLKSIARKLNKPISELRVAVLERPRHLDLVAEIREAGAKVCFFDQGTVAVGIETCLEAGRFDLMLGIAGAPEAILTAVALKCLGGDFQAQFQPLAVSKKYSQRWADQLEAQGYHQDQVFSLDQLVSGDCLFVATSITKSVLGPGIYKNKAGQLVVSSCLLSSRAQGKIYLETVRDPG